MTRVSLRQVAEAARVSASTASLALSGSPRVAKRTRHAVELVAGQMGYTRNLAFSCIASSRFKHAGRPPVIALRIEEGPWREHFTKRMVSFGMKACALSVNSDLKQDLSRLHATALVVCQREYDINALSRLPAHVVLWLDEGTPALDVDVVETQEWWSTTTVGIRRVQEAGYLKPALITVPANPRHWHDDIRTAATRMLKVPCLEWDNEAGSLLEFLRIHRPDVILGNIAFLAKRLRDLGVHLPFASLMISSPQWHPDIAGWVTDHESRELATLELIEWRIRHGPRQPQRIIISPRWRSGASLPLR